MAPNVGCENAAVKPRMSSAAAGRYLAAQFVILRLTRMPFGMMA
jgi:hypothetical protein